MSDPDRMNKPCETADAVTRRSVKELGDILKGKKPAGTKNLSHDLGSGGAGAGSPEGSGAGAGAGDGSGSGAGGSGDGQDEGQGNGGDANQGAGEANKLSHEKVSSDAGDGQGKATVARVTAKNFRMRKSLAVKTKVWAIAG